VDYDVSWERPHAVTDELLWQESDWYVFWDESAGVGGLHRVGQRPNLRTGQTTAFVFARGGERFVLNEPWTLERPISAEDRWATGVRVAGHTSEAIAPEVKRFTWAEPDSEGALELHNGHHLPRSWRKGPVTPTFEKFMKMMQSGGKLQCSGRVRGSVRIGRKNYEIDALMHRDRAWGVRDLAKATMHRYRLLSGTVGPQLSFATAVLDLTTGERPVMGYVVRNGVDEEVVDLRVAPMVDSDGYTVLSSYAELTLQSGEVVKLWTKSVQTFLAAHATSAISDSVSTFEYGGEQGFCVLSVCNNPGRGNYVPTQEELTGAAVAPGLSAFVPNPF
jgi:hypothetical protein